jgi:hypothetical protein
MTGHQGSTLPVTEMPAIAHNETEVERKIPLVLRFLRVKPCPIKGLRALATARYEKQREAGRDR